MKKLSPRVWLTLVLVGLVGQFAWTIENMYFNVYLYNTISTDPGYISAMVGWSAAAATLTTLLMGALSDRVGKRKLFICGGYLLWGLSTAAFGLVTVENAAKLFPAAAATAAAAVMIVVLDCVMTFFGSTANDAAFNAWITDTVPNEARGKAESVLAILPLISMLVIFGLFDGMTQRGEWQKFFGIFGGLVVLTGLVSVFLIPEPKLEPRKEPYLPTLVYGLRPAVVKENPALYLSFAAFCLFSVAVQVFFPYLIIYMQNYLHFDGYALVLGIVLIFASVVSVLSGRVIDRLTRQPVPFAAVVISGQPGKGAMAEALPPRPRAAGSALRGGRNGDAALVRAGARAREHRVGSGASGMAAVPQRARRLPRPQPPRQSGRSRRPRRRGPGRF